LPRGHTALAFLDVGVGFADTAAVVAVGFLRIYGFLHISICITPETMLSFDPLFWDERGVILEYYIPSTTYADLLKNHLCPVLKSK